MGRGEEGQKEEGGGELHITEAGEKRRCDCTNKQIHSALVCLIRCCFVWQATSALAGLLEEDAIATDESKIIDNAWRGAEVCFAIEFKSQRSSTVQAWELTGSHRSSPLRAFVAAFTGSKIARRKQFRLTVLCAWLKTPATFINVCVLKTS